MKEEKNYIHRRVCLCRQCGGTGTVTVYAVQAPQGGGESAL